MKNRKNRKVNYKSSVNTEGVKQTNKQMDSFLSFKSSKTLFQNGVHINTVKPITNIKGGVLLVKTKKKML